VSAPRAGEGLRSGGVATMTPDSAVGLGGVLDGAGMLIGVSLLAWLIWGRRRLSGRSQEPSPSKAAHGSGGGDGSAAPVRSAPARLDEQ
jgi:hypothetical protein